MMRQQLKWMACRYGERLGWPGLLAVTLVLSALLVMLAYVWPAEKELNTLTALTSHPVKQKPRATMNPQQKLANFMGQFPVLSERSRLIKQLMDIADTQSIVLDEVSYRMDAQQPDALRHYRIDFSTVASYAEVRDFINVVLSSMPLVSLESLTMQRDDSDSEIIEARMQFALHFAR